MTLPAPPEPSDEERKRTEIELAWAVQSTPPAQLVADQRKRWLVEHVKSQGRRCKYCLVYMSRAAVDLRPTLDHVIPQSAEGPDTFENTVAACHCCNVAKAGMPLEAFLRHPTRIARLEAVRIMLPDRVCSLPDSPFYDRALLVDCGIGVTVNGADRNDVQEYCLSGGWVRVRLAGKSTDRYGKPMTLLVKGKVEAYRRDVDAILTELAG